MSVCFLLSCVKIAKTSALCRAVIISLGHNHVYSARSCQGWIYYELIYMEVLTFMVEIILVMRRTSFEAFQG